MDVFLYCHSSLSCASVSLTLPRTCRFGEAVWSGNPWELPVSAFLVLQFWACSCHTQLSYGAGDPNSGLTQAISLASELAFICKKFCSSKQETHKSLSLWKGTVWKVPMAGRVLLILLGSMLELYMCCLVKNKRFYLKRTLWPGINKVIRTSVECYKASFKRPQDKRWEERLIAQKKAGWQVTEIQIVFCLLIYIKLLWIKWYTVSAFLCTMHLKLDLLWLLISQTHCKFVSCLWADAGLTFWNNPWLVSLESFSSLLQPSRTSPLQDTLRSSWNIAKFLCLSGPFPVIWLCLCSTAIQVWYPH